MKAETKSETVSKSVKYRDISLDMHQPRRTMKGVTKSAVYALARESMEYGWLEDDIGTYQFGWMNRLLRRLQIGRASCRERVFALV